MNEKTAEYAGNLLAVMHGDGGHYISDHGWKKATDDAIEKYYALTSERDEAVRERDGYKDDANTLDGLYHETLDALQVVKAERDELLKLAVKMAPHIIAFRTMTDVFHGGLHGNHSIAKASECSMCYLRAEVDAKLDLLTTDKAAQG